MGQGAPRKRSGPSAGSPFALIGAACVMAAVVAAMTAVNIDRQEGYAARILSEKGAALIRAFEAGTRTGMMGHLGAGLRIQNLLEQTADQADIVSLTVTDLSGRILAADDRALIGGRLETGKGMAALAPSEAVQWRLVTASPSGRRVFMVYRRFLPEAAASSGRRGPPEGAGPPPGRGPGNRGFFCSEECDAQGAPLDMSGMQLVIFVGLDAAPYEEAMASDRRAALTTAAVLLAFGLLGVAALFWRQNQRSARRMLRDATAIAEEVVAGLPVGLVVADPKGRVLMLNAAAEELVNMSGADLTGRPLGDFLPPAVLELAERVAREAPVREAGATIPAPESEIQARLGDGPPIPLGVAAAPIVTEDGRRVGSLLTLRDLRESKRRQAEAERREKLAAIGGLAAGAAHEIRNPLSSIKGYALYFGGKFPEGSEERASAAIMAGEVDRLNRVISELIECARAGEVRPRTVNLGELAAHALRLIRPDAQAAGVVLDDAGLAGAPEALADPDRLTQALLNLLLNAVQAMEPGRILRLRAGRRGDGRPFLAVEDQGAGMDQQTLARIFDPYFTSKAKGAGLGLTIAHKIVEAHGGEILVESQPGRGSVFTVILAPAGGEDQGGSHAGERSDR